MNGPDLGQEACFGISLAVGDIDGNGRPDMVVAAPPCPGTALRTTRLAIYPGARSFFASEPTVVDFDWRNPQLPNGSLGGVGALVGNVNGDRYPDVLIRGRYGVLAFAGGPDLRTLFNTPLFVVPGGGSYGGALLADVNGDGLDDILSARGATVSVYLSTPGAQPGPFTVSQTLTGSRLYTASDTNGDGFDDVAIGDGTGTSAALHFGCRVGTTDCPGGLRTTPRWTVSQPVLGLLSDRNGDGQAEALLGDQPFGTAGRVWLHLSDPQTQGLSSTPVWQVLGDPLFIGFGRPFLEPGDLNRDRQQTEFVIGSVGRVYVFFPSGQLSQEMQPDWAWPRSEKGQSLFGGGGEIVGRQSPLAIADGGDLNGDGYTDLVVASIPAEDSTRGRVVVLGGGRVPPEPNNTPRPFLAGPRTCGGLNAGGKADMTVDGQALARSLFIERKDFAADACEVAEGCVEGTGNRRLLRFTASIPNMGSAPALIPSVDIAPEIYEFDQCHGHDHLKGFASYELLDAQGQAVRVGRKQGYYITDVQSYCSDAAAPEIDYYPYLGISPGWSDVYVAALPCQWIDITGVPDGAYTVRVAINANALIDEDNVLPNNADVRVQITGDQVTVTP